MIFDSIETKQKILSDFLNIASFDGWSEEALEKAMINCGIDAKFKHLIFENGCLDIIDFYIHHYNQKAAKITANMPDFQTAKIRDKIRYSLYARFEVELDNVLALQRLVNFYVNPKNFLSVQSGPRPLIQALKTCYKIADFMWYNIGDQSTDFNFYTKRLTLAKIILRSLLVFLKDETEDLVKTKKCIDLEIEKVMKFEKCKAKFKKISATAKEGLAEFVLDENGMPKTPKNIFKSLPFIRLFKN